MVNDAIGAFGRLLEDGLVWTAENDAFERPARSWLAGASAQPASVDVSGVPFGVTGIDTLLKSGGLQSGMTHEFFSDWKNSAGDKDPPPCTVFSVIAANALLKSAGQRLLIWIGRRIWPTPFVLKQALGAGVARCLFIDPPDRKKTLWSIDTALRSGVAAAVITECPMNLSISRRLLIAARSGGALGLFSRPLKERLIPSAAGSRWKITPVVSNGFDPLFELELLKIKGPQLEVRKWLLEAGCSGGKDEKLSLYIPADLVDRSRETSTVKEEYSAGGGKSAAFA